MENFNYYEALDGCDVDFQKKKRRIAEVEDAIENLKMSADQDDKENQKHKEMLNLQAIEEKICQSDLKAAAAKKSKICDEIDQYEREIADLNKKIMHVKTEMDESEAFIQTQLNESTKCRDEYYVKFLNYPWVSKYEDIKKQQESIINTVKEKEAKIIELEKELSDLSYQERQKWKQFVGICVEIGKEKSKFNDLTKTANNKPADYSSLLRINCPKILSESSRMFNIGDTILNNGTDGVNGVGKSLSRSIISQRISPTNNYKIRPFRERQLSSFSPFKMSNYHFDSSTNAKQ